MEAWGYHPGCGGRRAGHAEASAAEEPTGRGPWITSDRDGLMGIHCQTGRQWGWGSLSHYKFAVVTKINDCLVLVGPWGAEAFTPSGSGGERVSVIRIWRPLEKRRGRILLWVTEFNVHFWLP